MMTLILWLKNLNKPLMMCDRLSWAAPNVIPPPLPYTAGVLKDVLVDPAGVHSIPFDGSAYELNLCNPCLNAIQKQKTPALALANHTFLGLMPEELKDLTPIEESIIALCHAKCWIIQLSEQASDVTSPHNQWGFHGNIIIYPQQSQKIASILPPSIEEIVSPICVIFVGSSPSSAQWLCDKARPLAVCADKVQQALIWLKEHNPLYSDIQINDNVLNSLPENGILPFHIEHVLPNVNGDVLTSRNDATPPVSPDQPPISCDAEIAFQKLVISDVDGHALSNEL